MNFQTSVLNTSYSSQVVELIRKINDPKFTWSDKQILETFSNNTLVLGVLLDNTLIGIAIFSYIFDEAELLYITVDNDYRSKGVAKAMLDYAINILEIKDIKNIFLEVDIKNTSAINLYKKLGFNKISIRRDYYKYPDGQKIDALIYQLQL